MDRGAVQPLQTTSPSKDNQISNRDLKPLQSNPKARSPPAISPPPLKRRRIENAPLSPELPGANPSKLTLTDRTASLALQIKASSGHQARGRDDVSFVSSTNSVESNQSKKPAYKCRACSHMITKPFDPMVRCPSCSRTYHESCRRPIRTKEQPEIEKCGKCAAPNRQRSRLTIESSSLSDVIPPTPSTTSDRVPRPSSANSSLTSARNLSPFKLSTRNLTSAAPIRSEKEGDSVGPGAPKRPGEARELDTPSLPAPSLPGEPAKSNVPSNPAELQGEETLPVLELVPPQTIAEITPQDASPTDQPQPNTSDKPPPPTPPEKETEEEPHLRELHSLFMPFEDPRDYPALHPQPLPPTIKRSSTFHDAFPQHAKPTIATMTRAEKDAKIAQIKRRPSRKSFFGDHLHPSRLLQRDPHDENEGMHKSEESLEGRLDASKGELSMREAFNLPGNPIPVLHDGQLAFKDGTLVNGRLPRSRVVYKVGRLFGGELRL